MFTKEIRFQPGYDYREIDADNPPGKRRGCHGLQVRFLLKGENGVVQFVFGTDWLPTAVTEGQFGPKVSRGESRSGHLYPLAIDLGYHWNAPRYEDQSTMKCDLIPSGECYYDGSSLNAENVMAAMFTGGHEAVWRILEERYAELDSRPSPVHKSAAPDAEREDGK